MKKLVLQSKYNGDTKWNFRGEAKNERDFYKMVTETIRQDTKLKVNNTYRFIGV
jgi:hypothetical protein